MNKCAMVSITCEQCNTSQQVEKEKEEEEEEAEEEEERERGKDTLRVQRRETSCDDMHAI